MKKNILYITAALVLALSSCDFLDHEPDMRATINTKEKVQLLLVSAYTSANNAAICEFSSDNIIDNTVPDPKTGQANAVNPLDQMYNEIFAWVPVVSSGSQDSPKYLWDANYTAIATANQALEAIEKLEAEGIRIDAEKGEALLSRAYHHFLLAGVFCQAWKGEASKQDLGITYMLKPETRVAPEYSRGPELVVNIDEDGDTAWIGGSLYDTFDAIERDLVAGLQLVSDEYYTIPRYHFNVKAAHAFAARFYLYKREWAKVVEHADNVLTTNDETVVSMLYDAQEGSEGSNVELQFNHFINPQEPSNLLIHTTMSSAAYAYLVPSYGRYQHNGTAQDFSAGGAGPCWSSRFPGFGYWSADQKLGGFIAKAYYVFEYTDKVNGYGYIHGVNRAFTTNETLLCRAEAKIYLNDLAGATNDFRLWCQGYNVNGRMKMDKDSNVVLTQENITSFYSADKSTHLVPVLHNLDMDASWNITPEQLPFVHCALHFRRIETLHDGLRWHDLKRYGIEIEHVQGKDAPRKLVWNDDRRAIQLPQEVIMAGLTANPREVLGDHIDGNVTSGSFDPSEVYTPSTPALSSAAGRPNGDFKPVNDYTDK